MESQRRILLALFLINLSAAFAFQNCSQNGMSLSNQATQDAKAAEAAATEKANIAAAPFAFEASIDRLTYISCPGNNDASGYGGFVFRASSENTSLSGLKYNSEFLQYVAEAETPLDPKTKKKLPSIAPSTLTAEQMQKYLDGSTLNKRAGLFFSLRQLADPRYPLFDETFTIGGSQFKENAPFIFDTLTNTTVTSALTAAIADEENISYIRNAPTTAMSRFTGTWNAYIDRGSFDNAINSQAYMALGYTTIDSNDSETQALARGPTATSKRIYGTGLKLSLSFPSSENIYPFIAGRLPHSNSQGRHLVGIEEYNLLTGQNVSSDNPWACDEFLTIVALREHEYCPEWSMSSMIAELRKTESTAYPDDASAFNDLTHKLDFYHTHLPVSEWFVNPLLKCAVPKVSTNTCYPVEKFPYDTNFPSVAKSAIAVSGSSSPVTAYDITKNCGYEKDGSVYATSEARALCPQFISLCHK